MKLLGQQQKTSPHSKESEMLVLGSMLDSFDKLKIGSNSLEESDFYFTEHKIIFSFLHQAYQKNYPADVYLISEELKTKEKLHAVGGISYLTTLVQYAGTSAHIEEYIEIIKNKSRNRSLINLCPNIQQMALGDEDPSDILIYIQEQLKLIENNKRPGEKFPFKFLDQFHQNFLLVPPEKKPMLFECLKEDGRTRSGFLPKGIVAMLLGAGGVGKTTLLAQLAISIASGQPFLSRFTPTEQCGENGLGHVFLGLGENQYDDIHRAMYKASKQLRNKQPELHDKLLFEASKRIAAFSFTAQQAAFIQNGKPSRYFREFKMRLEEISPKKGWDLIILDPISRIAGADAETDNAAATQFIALMEELIIDLPGNPTVLIAHHVNKTSINSKDQTQGAARGSSAFVDGVRWVCNYTSSENNTAVLKMTKSNFTEIHQEIKTVKDSDGFISILEEKIEVKKQENTKKPGITKL